MSGTPNFWKLLISQMAQYLIFIVRLNLYTSCEYGVFTTKCSFLSLILSSTIAIFNCRLWRQSIVVVIMCEESHLEWSCCSRFLNVIKRFLNVIKRFYLCYIKYKLYITSNECHPHVLACTWSFIADLKFLPKVIFHG